MKAVRFTIKGDVLTGASNTFVAYPAFKFIDNNGAKYLLLTLELTTTTLVPSFSAACWITEAYILALKAVTEFMFNTFLTAHWENLVMANYEVDPVVLAPYLPNGVELDVYEGKAFVSLVGFMFKKTKLFGVPIPFFGSFEVANSNSLLNSSLLPIL